MTARHRVLTPIVRTVFMSLFLIAALAAPWPSAAVAAQGAATPAYKDIPAETMQGGVTTDDYLARQADLYGWLMQETPAGVLDHPVVVTLTEQERGDLEAKARGNGNGPAVVGRTKALAMPVRFTGMDRALLGAARPAAGGVLAGTADGGFVWAIAVQAPDAGAVRLHLTGLNLPPDADLFFFGSTGQAFGPYQGRGPDRNGDLWTNTVFGPDAVLLLRHYGPEGARDLARSAFTIDELGHIGTAFATTLGVSLETFCSFNAPCIENASCHNGTPAEPAKDAVALMQWVSGAYIYTCTGGLLADTVSTTQIPYFLTANHCISKQTDANNLETYFQFSISCGSTSCPAQTHPGGIQRLGATIKATGTAGDYTLLQLNQDPPSGSVLLGWNNTPVANSNGVKLYRISHPAWAPQAYSDQHVDTSAPTCRSWPRGQRIYSRTDTAGTEGGSSGSPVVDGSGKVVGQLSGACGTNVNDACDNTSNATVDGAFAYYWSSVQPYLDPATTCTPVTEVCNDGVDNDCDGLIDCADSNCNGSPSCPTCSAAGASCTSNSQCCSRKCAGPKNNKTCR